MPKDAFEAAQHIRLLARVLDEAQDFILITDATPPSRGGPFIRYANESLLRSTGYSAEELVGESYRALLAPDNDPVTLQSLAESLECGRICEKEIRARRKDGSVFWIEFTGKPLSEDDANYWVAVGRDITVRRRAQDEIAALLNAIDAVSDHLEIYVLQEGRYVAAFQNAAYDPDASLFVETVLNQEPLRERLAGGEAISLPNDGLLFRPLGNNAQTVICVRRQPWLAAAS
jgi:PAS domain S-box-containing protein